MRRQPVTLLVPAQLGLESPASLAAEKPNKKRGGRPAKRDRLSKVEGEVIEWVRKRMGLSQVEYCSQVADISQGRYAEQISGKSGVESRSSLLGGAYVIRDIALCGDSCTREIGGDPAHHLVSPLRAAAWANGYRRLSEEDVKWGSARQCLANGFNMLDDRMLEAAPEPALEVLAVLDRIRLGFSVPTEKHSELINELGMSFALVEGRKATRIYSQKVQISRTGFLSWFPNFSHLHGYNLDLKGSAMASGSATSFISILRNYVTPESFAILGLDIALDYVFPGRTPPLLLPWDLGRKNVRLASPKHPSLAPFTVNTTFGTHTSERGLVCYDKMAQMLDKYCPVSWGQRLNKGHRDCCRQDTCPFSEWASETRHLDSVYPGPRADSAVCRNGVSALEYVTQPHIRRALQNLHHVLRVEASLRLKSDRLDRRPSGLVQRIPNPFSEHRLVHLGVVNDPIWKLPLVSARLEGCQKIKAELRKEGGPAAVDALKMKVDEYSQLSMPYFSQPHEVFSKMRTQLQGQLDAVFNGPLPRPSPIWRPGESS